MSIYVVMYLIYIYRDFIRTHEFKKNEVLNALALILGGDPVLRNR